MSDAFKREIDKGTIPGATVMVGRRGQIGWFEALGRQSPAASTPMASNSIFRIFSMTKPIVSIGIMMLLEEGQFLLNDPVAKYILEFADQKVGVESGGKLKLVPLNRPMTIQDLLRHTSGITYDHTGNSLVQQLYQQTSRLRSRKISNAEHAAWVASLPLPCQPGAEWNYSRSTDILGRITEVVSGKSLSAFLTGAHSGAAADGRDRVSHRRGKRRPPRAFAADPWTGEKVQLFNMLEQPVMESGGGGLVSTTMDYARFCQMLLGGGVLDGNRIIGRKTLELMASDHLGPAVKVQGTLLQPGHGFGLGFAVRTQPGIASFLGSTGQFFERNGRNLLDRSQEELFAVFMTQGPGQGEYTRTLVRNLVYAAVE